MYILSTGRSAACATSVAKNIQTMSNARFMRDQTQPSLPPSQVGRAGQYWRVPLAARLPGRLFEWKPIRPGADVFKDGLGRRYIKTRLKTYLTGLITFLTVQTEVGKRESSAGRPRLGFGNASIHFLSDFRGDDVDLRASRFCADCYYGCRSGSIAPKSDAAADRPVRIAGGRGGWTCGVEPERCRHWRAENRTGRPPISTDYLLTRLPNLLHIQCRTHAK